MGTFNTQKLLSGDPALIPEIAAKIESAFMAEGFNINNQATLSGGADISISKGGLFKAILGMRTALKISLTPQSGGILFDARVGIFGQQVVPTLIMWYFAWPVLLTQIWGLVQQSKLDDKALSIAEEVIRANGGGSSPAPAVNESGKKFCIGCGHELPADAAFCPHCGKKQ